LLTIFLSWDYYVLMFYCVVGVGVGPNHYFFKVYIKSILGVKELS
jgi:hypothetical protein